MEPVIDHRIILISEVADIGETYNILYEAVNHELSLTTEEFHQSLNHIHLCDDFWSPKTAFIRAKEYAEEYKDNTVILLGSYVSSKFREIEDTFLLPNPVFTWWKTRNWMNIPIPFYDSRWYDDDIQRTAVGLRLVDTIHEYRRLTNGN